MERPRTGAVRRAHLLPPLNAPGAPAGRASGRRRGSRGGRPPAFDKRFYKRRNMAERCFTCLKQWRGIATRHDETAESYRAAVALAPLRCGRDTWTTAPG
ncbi:hypothetical protein SLITK23_42390 [Streptomyces lividans]|nr:predicted protein [Streptomyces lividans TK24]THA99560.1 hypothetical protein E6R61_03185 [Streptomyces sp. LRa12]BDE40994.1 hypothetical protein SLITK23_42390 [Streptomyces lividans]GHC20790.1 hypothetical protein GCM10010348_51990 [Streptomyces anthocyanicus]